MTSSDSIRNPIAANDYKDLPHRMFVASEPSPTTAAALVKLNTGLLDEFDIDRTWFESAAGLSILSGNKVNADNPPIALAYSGHQFGYFVPLLGDGRAHMLGQIATNTALIDVQLKGSGRTAFSRGGDGRATLASVLREYLVSEAMAALCIPATRSLAVISTGETVRRERPFPGAILVRTATSHIRVGSFQHAANNIGAEAVKSLADFVIRRNYPNLQHEADPYVALLGVVAERQAKLIAQWMLVGFIHGVMNTDNMSIAGETIDFGPCAFIDEFNPQKVFSSIDQNGRYGWDKQPAIGGWNLTRFAETLLPLFDARQEIAISIAEEQLARFTPAFENTFYDGLRNKLGLNCGIDDGIRFSDATLAALAKDAIDFTVFFTALTRVALGQPEKLVTDLFRNANDAGAWIENWHAYSSSEAATLSAMQAANPVVIARNHRVEHALDAAVDNNDLAPFLELSRVLAKPFDLATGDAEFELPPAHSERVTQTFCGT